jgi:hypothetical protein
MNHEQINYIYGLFIYGSTTYEKIIKIKTNHN